MQRDGMLRKWIRQFNRVYENMHGEEQSGQPFVVSDDLVLANEENMCENSLQFSHFTSITTNFKNVSYETVIGCLNYQGYADAGC